MKTAYLLLLLVFATIISAHTINKQNDFQKSTYDSLQSIRDGYLEKIRYEIRGKEKMPVDSVFKNLKIFGGFPAENLLLAMNSWSRALGVGCNHCHTPEKWDMEGKPEKDIARQMSNMTSKIINDYLRKMEGLKNTKPVINCTSCHNGKLKPALRLE